MELSKVQYELSAKLEESLDAYEGLMSRTKREERRVSEESFCKDKKIRELIYEKQVLTETIKSAGNLLDARVYELQTGHAAIKASAYNLENEV